MPASMAEREAVSVRIPARLKSRAADVARARHVSFNTFVTTLIEKAVHDAEQQELYDAFSELGADTGMSDVGFAFAAQAEVALRD